MKVVRIICRILLGCTFVLSGLIKANDPLGTQYKISDYLSAWNLGGVLPDSIILTIGLLLAMVEVVLGVMLLIGCKMRLTSKVTLAFLSVMTLITLWLAITNAVSDCGCFGDAIVLTNWQTFWKNVVLMVAAMLLIIGVTVRTEDSSRPTCGRVRLLLSCLLPIMVVVLIAGYSLMNLPIVDFRPYKVGADVMKVDNFFVELNDEDITAEMLSADNVVLMVSPYIQMADEDGLQKGNEILKQAQKEGKKVYCLTASDEKVVEDCKAKLKADYPFCFADDIELKTMIRANPGIVELEKGIVVKKFKN